MSAPFYKHNITINAAPDSAADSWMLAVLWHIIRPEQNSKKKTLLTEPATPNEANKQNKKRENFSLIKANRTFVVAALRRKKKQATFHQKPIWPIHWFQMRQKKKQGKMKIRTSAAKIYIFRCTSRTRYTKCASGGHRGSSADESIIRAESFEVRGRRAKNKLSQKRMHVLSVGSFVARNTLAKNQVSSAFSWVW